MLHRITAFSGALLIAAPALALDISPAQPAPHTETAQMNADASPRAQADTPDEAPVGTYGLALATLALVGFMARR